MPETTDDAVPRPPPPRARRQVFNNLSTRILFFVFLSTFLSALVVSWISIHSIQTQLQRELERRFPTILEDRFDDVQALIDAYEGQLHYAAKHDGLRRALATKPTPSADLERLLTGRLEFMPDFSGLILLDTEGVPLASAGAIDAEIQQRTVMAIVATRQSGPDPEAEHFSLVFEDPTNDRSQGLLVHAVGDEAEPIGWIAGRHDFTRFAGALAPRSHEGSARIVLVASDGRILANGDTAPRSPVAPDRLERIADGDVHEYTSSDRRHVLGASKALPHGHWSLIVEAPFDVAFAPVLSVVSRIFVSDLVIILVFSILAYRITATIMRPISALSEGARRISRGDFDHAIPETRASDEIGLLIRTFNDMVEQLRRNSIEIADDQKRLTEQNEELHRANEVLAQLSITDGLTKLHNHRYFQDHLTREIKRVGRTGDPLSMILMDLDDFKRLNDFYGHAAGDDLLVGVANILLESVRESDLLARYGGEEFVILATGTSHEGAIAMAEKIRMSVEASSHIVDDSMRPIRVTISIGVATYDGDRKAFFQAADRALYDAKAQGKNCVVAAPPSPAEDPDAT